MQSKDIPIKSTWRDAIGPKLTNRRITNRIKEGWYGPIEKLKLLSRSPDKNIRNKAKADLVRYEGVVVRPKRIRAGQRVTNIEEFC